MKRRIRPKSGYTSFKIHNYHYELFAKEGNVASVNLQDAKGKTFAIAIFSPNYGTLPQQYEGSDGIFRVFYRRFGLADVIYMLRNEKPVYFHYWHPDGSNTNIATTSEPVGEGEQK